MSELLKGAISAPMKSYHMYGGTGWVVRQKIRPNEGYSEEIVLKLSPGATIGNHYIEGQVEIRVLEGEVGFSGNKSGKKILTKKSPHEIVSRHVCKMWNASNKMEAMVLISKY